MLSTPTELQAILQLAPEWAPVATSAAEEGGLNIFAFCNRLGAKALYLKAAALEEKRATFLSLLRDAYLRDHLSKMLQSNQNLRRFWSQRRLSAEEQRLHIISFTEELTQKMEAVLIKHLNQRSDDGFKVLLPAYLQRAVQNAAVDYIRQEWSWEKHTLQDMHLDPDQEDPRQNVADDAGHAPENLALSKEQVTHLNQLRRELSAMITDTSYPQEALTVIDCLFGLGLTGESAFGEEMTMRECCDKLNIFGETQARRIARCQVFLDKGLELVRQRLREKLPSIVDAWQGELNVNCASRRELTQQIELTEGEIERLIKNRQFSCLQELVTFDVLKPKRLAEIAEKGAVAAFVPVDLNSATVRDLMDILSLPKPTAKRLASERPFLHLNELVARGLISEGTLEQLVARGALVRRRVADRKRLDLNRVDISELTAAGLAEPQAKRIARGRPFLTWVDLEEFLCCDQSTLSVLRQKFCLGLTPA